MICSRSLATVADFFFSPSRNEKRDMSLPRAEDALEKRGLRGVDEAHRQFFSKKPPHHVLVRACDVGPVQMNRRYALVGAIEHGLRFRDDADQSDAPNFLKA